MTPETESNTELVTTKTCGSCGLTKPIERFRFKNRAEGRRHSECNVCAASQKNRRLAGKRTRNLTNTVQELAGDSCDPSKYGATTRIEVVVRAMIDRFGGLEQFAEEWTAFLRLAQISGKHHLIQRSFEVLLRLLEVVDRTKAQQPDFDGMDDEQLEDAMSNHTAQFLWSHPSIAVLLLEEQGWKLEPPSEGDLIAEPLALTDQTVAKLAGLYSKAQTDMVCT